MEPARKIPPELAQPVPSTSAEGIDGISSADKLREAALNVDRTRRSQSAADTSRAVLLWEGLLRGSLNLVDWFDADGRRLVLLKLNPEKSGCGCGLTKREQQVAVGAAFGESSKVTGYRLGISPSRVSALLRAAMQKLGVRTKAQLVIMVRVLENTRQDA